MIGRDRRGGEREKEGLDKGLVPKEIEVKGRSSVAFSKTSMAKEEG